MLTAAIALAISLTAHPVPDRPVGDPATSFENVQLDSLEGIASEWLVLVDAFQWDESFAAAGRSFRDPNTIAMWRDASQTARVPLGKVLAREVQTIEMVEASQNAGRAQDQVIVRFATQFENKAEATEVVTLEQEHGEWKVIGYYID